MKRKKVGLVGCGTLGNLIARGIAGQLSGEYSLAGVADIKTESALSLSKDLGCPWFATLEKLMETHPDLLVEATFAGYLKEIAEFVLKCGCDLIPLSVGALADSDFYRRVSEQARLSDTTLYIPSGAIGGLDIMNAARIGGDLYAEVTTEKPPRALADASYMDGKVLSEDHEEEVFFGSAAKAIEGFPKNVNVAVAVGLSTCGPEHTMVRIRSNPRLTSNRHTILLSGRFGKASIQIEAVPSPTNPRTSELAAYSVLALLQKIASPVKY